MGKKSLSFGVRMPATHPIKDVVATVQHAESAGFDACWFPDSHLNYREVWTTLGAVAVSTDRVTFGPTVTNLATRHPTVTASAARAVAEAAPGRFLLGLGAGDSALGFDNLRNATVSELRQGVADLRTLLSGGGVQYGDFEARLRKADVDVPIYVAASGPKTLAMAGAVADGVIIMMGNVEGKMAHIRRGAAEAGRQTPPVFVYTTTAIVDDVPSIAKTFKPACVRIAELEGLGVFEEAGVRFDAAALRDHKMGAQGDLGHLANSDEIPNLVDQWVSDEAALWFAKHRLLVGSESDIRNHLDVLTTQGIAGVTMNQMSGSALPDRLIESLGPLVRSYESAAAL